MGWRQIPCYAPSRNSDNIQEDQTSLSTHHLKIKVSLLNSQYLLRRTLHRPTPGEKNLGYEDLTQEEQSTRWELKYFLVEVGSKGFTKNTLRTCCKFFGLTNKETRNALESAARTSPWATYTFWHARNIKQFGSWELVNRPSPTQLKMSNLLRLKQDQDPVTSLTMYGACTFRMFLQSKGFTVGSC